MKSLTAVALSFFAALSAGNPINPLQSILNLKDSRYQAPLTPPTLSPDGAISLEIEAWNIFGIPVFTTPIAVGTPNQVFRAWVGLDFDGLLVRSAACDYDESDCGYGADLGLSYNASASSTAEDAHERFYLPLGGHHAYGNVSRDTLSLVNFELENVTLGAIDEIYGENYFFLILADIADGALGLAPPNATTKLPYSKYPSPNILSHLLTQSSLTSPLLSITLPPSIDIYALGSITLGSLPTGHSSQDISARIPLGDRTYGWNAPLTSLTLEDQSEDKNAEIDLSGKMLHPSLATSGLNLPVNLTETLYTALHALPDSGWIDGREFNCSYRHKLPTLTFSFPSSTTNPPSLSSATHSLSLTEEDYTLHGYIGDDEICFLTIIGHEDEGEGYEDVLAVGTPLWDKWHVVFELEEGGSMGLIERETRDGESGVRQVDFGTMRRRGKEGAF